MNLRSNRYAYRNVAGAAAGDAAGGGGTGGAGGAGAGGAAGAGAGEGAGAATAGGEGGSGTPGAGSPTLLASGAPAAVAGEGGTPAAVAPLTERVPAKYHVLKADGTLDTEATLGKQADAYTALEKKLGAGGGAEIPATPEEYAPELPEGVTLDELKTDPLYQAFLKDAHGQKFSNEQVSFVLGEWFKRGEAVAAGADAMDMEGAATALRSVWKDEDTMKANIGLAYRATEAIAAKAGVDVQAVMKSATGNDPNFLRLMASIAPEFVEDTPPGGPSVNAQDFQTQMNDIRGHAGYADKSHPEHAALMQRQAALYEKRYGKAPAGPVTR